MPGRFGPSPNPAVHPTADRVLLRRKSITVKLHKDDLCPRLPAVSGPRTRALAPLERPQSTLLGSVLAEMGLL